MTMGAPETSGREESKRSGFRLVLYALLALGGLFVLTCGGLLVFAARHPAVQQFAETMAESQSAPGTEQLRDAGCAMAQVFDFKSALAPFSSSDDQENSEATGLKDLTVVQCMPAESNPNGLGCDEVATIYSSAVADPPNRFLVQMVAQSPSQVDCQVVYGADGTAIAPLDQYHAAAMAGPDI